MRSKLLNVKARYNNNVIRGIYLAVLRGSASLLSSHARTGETGMRRPHGIMKDLKRMLMAGVMCCIVSAGVFAQKQQDQKNPPPKEDPPPRVKVEEKNPPQDNRGQGGPRGDDKKSLEANAQKILD
jgi:hypothetical protein